MGALAIFANAHAGIFDEDARREVKELRAELAKKDQETDARIVKLDESIKSLGIIQLLNQIDQLNGEIAKLRGQIEVLSNQNDILTKRQKDFYLDIDTRLRKLEGTPADSSPGISPVSLTSSSAGIPAGASSAVTPPPISVVPAAASAPPQSAAALAAARDQADKVYDVGSNLFKRNDFAAAIRAFQTYMKDYPTGALVSNAQYWIGISYRNLKDYANARSAQESLIRLYPDSPKVPDALLEIANVQGETGDAGSARNTLEDIIARYPASDAATKARTRLAPARR